MAAPSARRSGTGSNYRLQRFISKFHFLPCLPEASDMQTKRYESANKAPRFRSFSFYVSHVSLSRPGLGKLFLTGSEM